MIGGAGVAGLAGLGAMVYRAAPTFWNQFAKDLGRDVQPSWGRPRPDLWPDRGLYAAWLGHSTVLLKIDGITILTDPVFSERVGLNFGPMTLGLKRLVAPAMKPRQLPPIDVILSSHAHMDHLDVPSLEVLESRQTTLVMAPRTSDLVRGHLYGFVRELSWGERTRVGPIEILAFEVNHWGARRRTDTFRGYNGYLIRANHYRVLFGGDTAVTDSFRALRSSKPIQLAIMPIGAYNPWIRYHCTPEEAWRMGNEAGTEFFFPVHHQTFKLSREPILEPIERFCAAAGRTPERVAITQIGQEFNC